MHCISKDKTAFEAFTGLKRPSKFDELLITAASFACTLNCIGAEHTCSYIARRYVLVCAVVDKLVAEMLICGNIVPEEALFACSQAIIVSCVWFDSSTPKLG